MDRGKPKIHHLISTSSMWTMDFDLPLGTSKVLDVRRQSKIPLTCAGGVMIEASAPFSCVKQIAHSVFMFYSMLHALCPMRFNTYASGRSDRRQRRNILIVDQGFAIRFSSLSTPYKPFPVSRVVR